MCKRRIFLILIIFLATVLRFYQLGKTPISLEWDEVAIGYDAYSILKTGRDQFGKFLPLTFRSLDDYKPPIYEYLTVPSVALFDLNEFSVRFPSAFIGTLTVIATYWLVLAIFSKLKGFERYSVKIALLSAFLLSVSPWHLQFSRAAFEVNVSVFITVMAVSLFLYGLSKPKYFILSAVFFGLDLFSYHSARIVAPLLLLSLFILFNRSLPTRKYILSFFLIFAVFTGAFIPILISKDAQIRFIATNIFNPGTRYLSDIDRNKIYLEKRLKDKEFGFELAGKIYHNQRLIFTDYDALKTAFSNYRSNFGFEYLFIKGDVPLHHAPGFGLLHIWLLPFLVMGLIVIFTKGLNRYTLILPLWILFVPIPNAVTREAPHAVRTELMLPTFQIVSAFGLFFISRRVSKESGWVFALMLFVSVTAFILNHSFYLHQYYVHTNAELSDKWMYGRKEAVEYTEKNKDKYDRVIVSLRADMPYIFWLFYSKYPPQRYIAGGGTISGGFADERNHFDKYEFRNFDYNSLTKTERLLLVGVHQEIIKDFPPDANFVKSIYNLDGSVALKIAENR